jgi:hypothetical protein
MNLSLWPEEMLARTLSESLTPVCGNLFPKISRLIKLFKDRLRCEVEIEDENFGTDCGNLGGSVS